MYFENAEKAKSDKREGKVSKRLRLRVREGRKKERGEREKKGRE